jgi:hypothetical protein
VLQIANVPQVLASLLPDAAKNLDVAPHRKIVALLPTNRIVLMSRPARVEHAVAAAIALRCPARVTVAAWTTAAANQALLLPPHAQLPPANPAVNAVHHASRAVANAALRTTAASLRLPESKLITQGKFYQ